MLKNIWFMLCLLIFVFTIRYAVDFARYTRCFVEYACIIHQSRLLSATFRWRLQNLESEDVRQLHEAVEGLHTAYREMVHEESHFDELSQKMMKKREWMESVDKALGKGVLGEDVFADDEATRKDFDLAYDTYVDLVAKIAKEVMEAERTVFTSEYFRRLHFGLTDEAKERHRQELNNKRQTVLSSKYRKPHNRAVRNLMGKIPYRYSNALDVWQATTRDEKGYWHQDKYSTGIQRISVWTKRFGNKDLAVTLNDIMPLVLFVWLGPVVIRTLEIFTGTYLVVWLQAWVLGILWSVYFDAPRQAILWLLRKIDAGLGSIKLKPGKDSELKLDAIGEIRF